MPGIRPGQIFQRAAGIAGRAWRRLARLLDSGQRRDISLTGSDANARPVEPIPSVLVYTVSKVGTNMLRQGLRDAGLSVYKAHTLNPRVLRARMARDGVNGRVLHTDRAALAYVENVLPSLPTVMTVSLIRESIGRNMSGFFQTLWHHGITPPYDGVNVDELIALFFSKFNHRRADDWFVREFGPSVRVRPFAFGFDPDVGYCQFTSGRFVVLFMQIELGNERLGQVASRFVGRPVRIQPANTGQEKPYGRLYEEFKRRITFPQEYLDRLLSSKVMVAFYSEAQREHIGRFYRREIPHLHPLPRASVS